MTTAVGVEDGSTLVFRSRRGGRSHHPEEAHDERGPVLDQNTRGSLCGIEPRSARRSRFVSGDGQDAHLRRGRLRRLPQKESATTTVNRSTSAPTGRSDPVSRPGIPSGVGLFTRSANLATMLAATLGSGISPTPVVGRPSGRLRRQGASSRTGADLVARVEGVVGCSAGRRTRSRSARQRCPYPRLPDTASYLPTGRGSRQVSYMWPSISTRRQNGRSARH